MAVYSDNMPDGVDVIFNTNKKKGVPALGEKDNTVLKRIKDDPENPFGTTIKDADDGGQYWYKDKKTGEEKLGLINKKSSEGDWSDWADALPSQFLSKQSKELAQRQLNLAKQDRYTEFESIMAIDNPTIKKHFLKIASLLLAVITIAVFSGFAANAERMFPHNPISEDSKTDLEPEINYSHQ